MKLEEFRAHLIMRDGIYFYRADTLEMAGSTGAKVSLAWRLHHTSSLQETAYTGREMLP